MHALQHCHQQLYPSHPPNVGGQQGAIHALFARLERKGMDLGVGHLLEGLIQEIDAAFLHVAAQTFAEVVQGAQVEIPLAQLTIPNRIAYLNIEASVVVQFFVRPAVGGLEKFQRHQHVDRHIRTRGHVCIQHLKGRFIQAAKELLVEGFRPRVVQAFAQRFGQFVHMAGEGDLQVTVVFAKHDGSPGVWVAHIILGLPILRRVFG
jgi:hypothetical protein